MSVDDGLTIPEEPESVKNFILSIRSNLGESGRINWDSTAIWAGNRIPQYLWKTWSPLLRDRGFTWQTFLRLMKFRTDDAILWLYEKISWEEFIRRVLDSIKGPLGQAITGKSINQKTPIIE